ncbi:hypothetical protein QYF61_015902 [Mycteria americana]|uniref:Uncharacterized protein n=1 Tax=Mycteria americana TaxID=33587 RepID=A0AAN7ND30_MYCAM|nr:hypothetical protein QYF61_015902 [Mycteria americana]
MLRGSPSRHSPLGAGTALHGGSRRGRPLAVIAWCLGHSSCCFPTQCRWRLTKVKSRPFTEEPDRQHTFPSLGAPVAAVLGDAAQKDSWHYHNHINQMAPNIPFLTTCSNGTDTADESHKTSTPAIQTTSMNIPRAIMSLGTVGFLPEEGYDCITISKPSHLNKYVPATWDGVKADVFCGLYTSFKPQVFRKVSGSRKSSFTQGGKHAMFAAQDSNAIRMASELPEPPISPSPSHASCKRVPQFQLFQTESQNHIGWKRPLRSSSPTINLTLPKPPLHHVSKHLIQTSFKYLQGWRLNHFPGQPVPVLDNPLGEEKFPNIQSKPPLAQLEDISSCPITCYLGEETDPHLSTTSFQVVVESDEVSPQPPFLQAKQSQLPQPLLIRLLLQTLHQLRCPSLHTLQYLNIPLVVGGPKLNTVFEVRPHQCRVQGHNHFPSPAGHAIFDTSQDAIGFLGRLGTLLAHIQAAVNKHPQVLLCQAAFQPLFPKPAALHGVAVAQVQDLALGLVKPHTIDLGPSIQPVQVPLQSLPTLKQINTPTQLGVVCKLTESTLDPFVQNIDKDVKQNWPQH